MIYKILATASILFLLASCNKDCITCSDINTALALEFCDDSDFFYADMNGNVIAFEDLQASLEASGHVCE